MGRRPAARRCWRLVDRRGPAVRRDGGSGRAAARENGTVPLDGPAGGSPAETPPGHPGCRWRPQAPGRHTGRQACPAGPDGVLGGLVPQVLAGGHRRGGAGGCWSPVEGNRGDGCHGHALPVDGVKARTASATAMNPSGTECNSLPPSLGEHHGHSHHAAPHRRPPRRASWAGRGRGSHPVPGSGLSGASSGRGSVRIEVDRRPHRARQDTLPQRPRIHPTSRSAVTRQRRRPPLRVGSSSSG